MKKIILSIISFLCITIIICGCSQNNYSIKPVSNYAVTNSDFDFLTDEDKKEIGLFMSACVEWYNTFEFKGESMSISVEKMRNELLENCGAALVEQTEANMFNKKNLLALRPATDFYASYLDIVVNSEQHINIGSEGAGSTSYSIDITADKWKELHDQINQAMDFYYRNGDRNEMNKTQETHYLTLTKENEKGLVNYVESLVSNPNLHSEAVAVQDQSTGAVSIDLNITEWGTKEEYFKQSPIDYKKLMQVGAGLVASMNDSLNCYKNDYPEVVLNTNLITSNDDLMLVFDASGKVVWEATDDSGKSYQDYVEDLGYEKLRKTKAVKSNRVVDGNKFKSAKEIYAIYTSIINDQTDGSCNVVFTDGKGLVVSYKDNPLIAIECQYDYDTLQLSDTNRPDRLCFIDYTNPRSQPCLEHMAFFLQGIIGEMSYDEVLDYIKAQSSNGRNGVYEFGTCFAIDGKLFELVNNDYEYGIWFSENHIDYANMDVTDAMHDLYWLDEEKDGLYDESEENLRPMLDYYTKHEKDYICRYNDLKKIFE